MGVRHQRQKRGCPRYRVVSCNLREGLTQMEKWCLGVWKDKRKTVRSEPRQQSELLVWHCKGRRPNRLWWIPEFALWLPAPGGSAQQPGAPEAQRRRSAQGLERGALAEIRVWSQVLGPSLQKICGDNRIARVRRRDPTGHHTLRYNPHIGVTYKCTTDTDSLCCVPETNTTF